MEVRATSQSRPTVWKCPDCGNETSSPDLSKPTCVSCGSPILQDELRNTSDDAEQGEPSAKAARTDSSPRRGGRWILALSWLYAFFILAVLIVIHWVGTPFWIATILIMSPKAMFLIPLAILALASAIQRSPSHGILQGATALAVIGPLMGLSFPIHQIWSWAPESGETLRVLTYNLEGTANTLDAGRWIEWVSRQEIDVVLMQEPLWKTRAIPENFTARGWSINKSRTIATRLTILEDLEPLRDRSLNENRYSARLNRCRLKTSKGHEIVVASVHLPTLRYGFKSLRQSWNPESLNFTNEWWGTQLSRVLSLIAETTDEPMLIGGDFNVPSDESRLAALRSSFQFAFDEAGWGYGFTRPTEFPWVRIDHLLSTPEWHVNRCFVGPDFGSDHLPLIAEYVLPNSVPGARVAAKAPAK